MSHPLGRGDHVVVTGAAGFIGSAVTRALVRRGVEVVALTEPGAATTNLDGLDVERREVDVTDERQLNGVFDQARYCFHLAAKFGFWAKDPSSFYAVNVYGTRHVVRAAAQAGGERIVYTSLALVRELQADEVCRRARSVATRRPRSASRLGTADHAPRPF